MNGVRSAVLVAVVLVAAAALAGCSQSPVPATPAASPAASAAERATPTTSATPGPAFDANGSAADNKLYFDSVNAALFAANGSANGQEIIDNLVRSGFDKSAMQVTPDTTSIGVRADAVLFSVRIGKSCLLGQHGSAYSSAVEPALAGGKCLVGKTRPIDW